MRKDEARTRPAHDVAGAGLFGRAVTVDLAPRAGGLVRPVGAAGEALQGVGEKLAAVVAELPFFRAVMRVAKARHHRFERALLFIEPRNGLEAGHAVDALRSLRCVRRLVFGRVCHAVSFWCCWQGLKEEKQYSVTMRRSRSCRKRILRKKRLLSRRKPNQIFAGRNPYSMPVTVKPSSVMALRIASSSTGSGDTTTARFSSRLTRTSATPGRARRTLSTARTQC